MTELRVESLSLSTVKLTMIFHNKNSSIDEEKEIKISEGTGFLWKVDKDVFLITNWHNVTGLHYETRKCLNKQSACTPNKILAEFFCITNGTKIPSIEIPLYKGKEDCPQPEYNNDGIENKNWYEHPSEDVDVVAILLPLDDYPDIKELLLSLQIIFANEMNDDISVNIAQDVFILGYPLRFSMDAWKIGSNSLDRKAYPLPIWKRGSIATELSLNGYNDTKHTFLVDTATKQGMSGSPVYAIISAGRIYTHNNSRLRITKNISKKFLGIYSGRLGEKEFEAQLGIVWGKKIIEELIENAIKIKQQKTLASVQVIV